MRQAGAVLEPAGYVPRRVGPPSALPGCLDVALVRDHLDHGSVLLVGPEGVGASWLAREAARSVDVFGRILANGSTAEVPFAGIVPLVESPGAATDWPGIAGALERMLPVTGRPPTVLVDDIEFLDPASAGILAHLAGAGRLCILATMHTGREAPAAVRAMLRDGRAVSVPLHGLAPDGVRRLGEALLGCPPSRWLSWWLHRVTHGNPRLIGKLLDQRLRDGTIRRVDGLATLAADRPPAVPAFDPEWALSGRFDDRERAAVELVAVGGSVPWSVAVDLVDGGLDVRLADPLLAAHLRATVPSGARALHRHRLRSALLARGATPAARLTLALRAIEDGFELDEEELWQVGETACRLGLADQVARVIRARDRVGADADRTAVLRAWQALLEGRPDDAADVLDTIQPPGPELAGRVRRLHTIAAIRLGRRSGSSTAARIAALANAGEYAEAVVLADQDAAETGWAPDTGLVRTPLAWSRLQLGDGPGALRVAGTAPVADLAGEPLRQHFEAWAAVRTEGWQCWSAVDELAPTLLESAMAATDRALAGVVVGIQGRMALLCGRAHEAELLLREARHHLQLADPGKVLGLIGTWLVRALAEQGVADDELLAAATAQLDAAPEWLRRGADGPIARAWVAAAGGDPVGARAVLCAAARDVAGHSSLAEAAVLHEALRLGDRDGAIAERLTALAGATDLPAIRLRAQYAGALTSGSPDQLLQVSASLEVVGAILYAAEAAAEAGAVLRDQHRENAARAAVARTALLLEACPGARTPALRQPTETPLTARQREVADLAAGGLSSRQIAEELHLSVRTVESHLYRAMRQVGVRSRAELRALLPAMQ